MRCEIKQVEIIINHIIKLAKLIINFSRLECVEYVSGIEL